MSNDIEQKIAADMTCSICLEIFTRPITLIPCFHSYCKQCLQLYVKTYTDENGIFPCPDCRVQITLPSEGIEGLRHNHTLQSIVDNLLSNKNKDNGKEVVPTHQQVPETIVDSTTTDVDLSSYTVVETVENVPKDENQLAKYLPEEYLAEKYLPEEYLAEKYLPEKEQTDINIQTNKTSEISSNEPTRAQAQAPNPANPPVNVVSLPPLPTLPSLLPSAPIPKVNLYPNISGIDNSQLYYETYIPQCNFCSEGLLTIFGKYSKHVNGFLKPYGIAINRAGNIFISDLKGGRIFIFSSTGVFLTKIVPPCDVYGIAISEDQRILATVSRTEKSILHSYDMKGHLTFQYTGLHFQYTRPSGVAVNSNGYAIVTSLENDCVYIFTEEGKLSHKFGWKGAGNERFNRPNFVTTNQKLQIIVSDFGNNCIKVFSNEGKFKCSYGKKGKDKGMLYKPMGVCTDKNNNIIVADYGNYRVQAFSPKGRSLGFPVYDTFRIGKDISPINVAIDRHDNIVVLLIGDQFAEVRIYEWKPEEV